MGSLSVWHWLIVLVIVVLVFGTGKLKNMGKDLGGAIRGFKEGMNEGETDAKKEIAQSRRPLTSRPRTRTRPRPADHKAQDPAPAVRVSCAEGRLRPPPFAENGGDRGFSCFHPMTNPLTLRRIRRRTQRKTYV